MRIGERFTLSILSLVVIIGLLSTSLYYTARMSEESDRLESLGGTMGGLLEHSLDHYMLTRDTRALGDVLDRLKTVRPIRRIRLFNRDGIVKASTDSNDIETRMTEQSAGCRGCHDKGRRGLLLKRESIFTWVQPVENKTECHRCHDPSVRNNGVFVIDFSTAGFEQYARRDITREVFIFIPSIGLIGLVIFLLSSGLIKRLTAVTERIGSLKEGDYSVRIATGGADEITRLEDGFNEMAEAIHSREREKNLLFKQVSRSYLEWQHTFDSITELIAIIDSGFNIVRANRTFAEYLEASSGDRRTGNCLDFFYGVEAPRGDSPFRTTMEEGRAVTAEAEDNRGRTFQISTFPYAYPDADFQGAILVARDITVEKSREKALRQSDEKRKMIVENINEVVYMVSFADDGSEETVEFVSPQTDSIIGYSREEILGRDSFWKDSTHPEDLQSVISATRGIIAGGVTGIRQYRIRHGTSGEYRWIEDKIVPQTGGDGRVVGYFGAARDITQRKRMEDAVEEQLHFLQALINAIPNPIFYKDTRGVYLGCNEAFQTYLGAGKESIIGKTVYDVAPQELAERYYETDLALLREPGMQTYESFVMHADGTKHDVIFYKSTFLTPNGSVGGLVGTILDITERKRSEKIIKRNFDMQTAVNSILKDAQEEMTLTDILQRAIEHLLSLDWLSVRSMGSISLVEDEPDVLVMKAQKNLPRELIRRCARIRYGECICGRAAAEKTVQFMDHMDHRHEICYDNASPHGHYCVPILYAERTVGVLNLYLNERTQLSAMEMDYFEAIAAALAGIIQHKRAEEDRERLIRRLRDVLEMVSYSQKQWQDTFDSITDLVSIHDRDFTIIRANQAFAAYFGLTPEEVVNRKCDDFFRDGGPATPGFPHELAMDENRAITEEIPEAKTGAIFRISTFPYRSPGGEIVGTVRIARDITDEKNNEMRLIMAERLASLGQMAAGIAHEINNPLASIAGCTEGLLARVRRERYDRQLFENYLGIIMEEISRCKNITSGMLSVIRQSTYEKSNIDINAAIEKTLEIIGFQGRLQNVAVTKDFRQGLPPIRGSEGELRQIFMTVITNALDAMAEKGALTLKTELAPQSVIIEISDSGEGILPENINRIFDPFFTTKPGRGGTGLGLSIARKIILNHKGDIKVFSRPEKGATFRIVLPVSQSS